MKHTKHLLIATLAILLLTSCGSAEDGQQVAGTPVCPDLGTWNPETTQTEGYPETTLNHVWGTAASWTELKPPQYDFDYSTLTLPDYRGSNPVRYMDIDLRGEKCNGWQNFGTAGELRTTPQPMGSTYLYQTYSYFIRNDLRHLYPNDSLPTDPEYLSKWLADISAVGRRALWYSAGAGLPSTIDRTAYEELISDSGERIGKVTYLLDGQKWVVYLLCEEDTASAFAIRPNEDGDYVINFTDSIAKSYREKVTS